MDITRKMALVDYGKLELQENCGDIKTLESGTAKIDVAVCNTCGSDMVLYRGKRPPENGRYLGYELFGAVVDPGDSANSIKRSMRVTSEFSRAYGRCWNCRNGPSSYCRSMDDTLLPGGFLEETLVLNMQKYSFISPVSDIIDGIIATLPELANCAYYVVRQANVEHEEIMIIFGMGPVGLVVSRIIKSMGVDVVAGVNSSKARLEKVRSFGSIEVIGSNNGNWQDQILEICGSKGMDVITELTEALPILQNVLQVVRPGGRTTAGSVYSGFAEQVKLLPIMRKGLTIRGSRGSHPHPRTDSTSAAVDILVRFQDDLKKLITVYGYKDTLRVSDGMMSGLVIKPIIQSRS